MIESLTAETEPGRRAIQEVMQNSYSDEIGRVPPAWTRARVVDEVPVAWIQVDPNRRMEMPMGELRYAFVLNVATRQDRRREGHFRALMLDTLDDLRRAGVPVVVLHGQRALYRPLSFGVFTYHCGIFATPDLLERGLGRVDASAGGDLLKIEEFRSLHDDLLLVSEVKATSLTECRHTLLAAAAIARQRGKARILFEHPSAPSYGSRYPIRHSPQTLLAELACACGAALCVQGANPEEGSVPDADWIKVLDAAVFLQAAVACARRPVAGWPDGLVSFDTDAGQVTLRSRGDSVVVTPEAAPEAPSICWSSSALAQLATGYRSAGALATSYGTPLGAGQPLLQALFPRQWRFTRNESWTFKA